MVWNRWKDRIGGLGRHCEYTCLIVAAAYGKPAAGRRESQAQHCVW
jgi:hypothetical protein